MAIQQSGLYYYYMRSMSIKSNSKLMPTNKFCINFTELFIFSLHFRDSVIFNTGCVQHQTHSSDLPKNCFESNWIVKLQRSFP